MRTAHPVLFDTAVKRNRRAGKRRPRLVVARSSSLLLFLQEIAPQDKELFIKLRQPLFIAAETEQNPSN